MGILLKLVSHHKAGKPHESNERNKESRKDQGTEKVVKYFHLYWLLRLATMTGHLSSKVGSEGRKVVLSMPPFQST